MVTQVEIGPFLEAATACTMLDVRTADEHAQAHIPGALNLPLFAKDERAMVGTTYRAKGREAAILTGLDIVGPKLRKLVERASEMVSGQCLMYCWRGGMRSASLAWLLDFYGIRVSTLVGGYKAFRRLSIDLFEQPWRFIVVGGKTGSAKTEILHALRERNEQVLDLEDLANHRGSAFGGLGLEEQPSQEQFENLIGYQLWRLDPARPVWIEDESHHVGRRIIPEGIWNQKCRSHLLFLEVPMQQRARFLVETYGNLDILGLRQSIEKIERRLGGLETKNALSALDSGDLETVAKKMLAYYDRAYEYDLTKREPASITRIETESINPDLAAELLIDKMAQFVTT